MFEVVKSVLFVVLCICVLVSLFLTVLPTGEDFTSLSFSSFMKLVENAPTIDTKWVEKIRIDLIYLQQGEDGIVSIDNPKPEGTNIGKWISWAVKQIAFNNTLNKVFNDYFLMPIRCILLVLTMLINVLIFVVWFFGICFGVVPIPV